jgi:hypothetical protein
MPFVALHGSVQALFGHGASSRSMSVIGAAADVICSQRVFRLLTRTGHGLSDIAEMEHFQLGGFPELNWVPSRSW